VERMTTAELQALPATVNVATAARALGFGRTLAYDLARRDEFPCRLLRIGCRCSRPQNGTRPVHSGPTPAGSSPSPPARHSIPPPSPSSSTGSSSAPAGPPPTAPTTHAGTRCARQATASLHGEPRCGLRRHSGPDGQTIPLTRSGLPPIRFHDLRHTAASLTYRVTRDLKLVSELLGHSSIKITADIYTNIFADVDRAAAEAVAQLVPRTITRPSTPTT